MVQTIEQTDEEKMAMYMKLSKKEIISMLLECQKYLPKPKVVFPSDYLRVELPERMFVFHSNQ